MAGLFSEDQIGRTSSKCYEAIGSQLGDIPMSVRVDVGSEFHPIGLSFNYPKMKLSIFALKESTMVVPIAPEIDTNSIEVQTLSI
jgi:hypothetical protein